MLFDVISQAYERTSVIVTTNLPFEQWPEVLGNVRLTGAVLDRLTHRCHILEASGESYRLRSARKKSVKTEKNRKVSSHLPGKGKVAILLSLALHNWRATRCTFQMPPAPDAVAGKGHCATCSRQHFGNACRRRANRITELRGFRSQKAQAPEGPQS